MTEAGSRYLQWVATCAGNLNIIALGAILGWTSPILPKLSEDNPIAADNPLGRPITKDEGSWVGSLVPFGVIFGSFISGYLGECMGRKRALLLSTFPFIVGWILVGTATSIYQIYAGRFVLGVSVSVPFMFLPMYTGEISDASIRGATGSFLQLFLTFGFLFSYSIGPFVSYTTFWMLCTSLHVVFFLCFMFMPESPYYLLSKGREAEGIEALARFRGKSQAAVLKEIEEMQAEIDEAFRVKTGWRDAFRDRVNRKAVILTSVLMSFQELMGIDVVLFYVEDIFREAGTKDTALSAIIIGLVQMLGSVVTPIIVDKSGRKILLIISSIGAGLTLGILGAYFFLKEKINYDLGGLMWLPLATLIVYIIAYSIGWGPLPWTIMSEMFGPGVKSKASSVCVFAIHLFSFILTKFFANVQLAFGSDVGFWFFAICCAINIVFILGMFPETKGKTLAEIQAKLSRGIAEADSVKAAVVLANGDTGHENLGLEIKEEKL